MEPFKFKLDGLLRLSKFKEEKIKIELGEIVKELTRLKSEIRQLRKDIDVGFQSQEKILENPTKGSLVQFYSYYIQGKREHIKSREAQIYSLEKKMDLKVMEMKKAMGDTKVMDGLKEKKYTAYKKELHKKEMALLDDLSIMKGREYSK
jgi:flagellar export protein FliJ